MLLLVLFITLVLVALSIAFRIYTVLPKQATRRTNARHKADTYSVAVFLGSGGHTTEAITLLSALDPKRYTHRTYLVSQGDTLSAQKAVDLEVKFGSTPQNYDILIIPRARQVHQPLIATPLGALQSLLACVRYITLAPLYNKKRPTFADVLILNGPGTSFVVCLAVYINKFFGLPAPVIIYVETFARVSSLSLSGKLIRPLADRFLVQWPAGTGGEKLSSKQWLV
ncbi:glycosyltransferase family 1 protein [Hypholoma sublateritium FD-334 SS-4]|uniref:UDP-N-acetylglucosamine transferase subunit ALG14 n=1 Tax=Hypholoma sublateritium (strain FD-334 SS-4) TaxID=945553 RepID=A0A0D2PXY0_HYPSF|nr:glycosyltransferase family 1 protein [Hypholoma sublateritium FD-334 SS-4]